MYRQNRCSVLYVMGAATLLVSCKVGTGVIGNYQVSAPAVEVNYAPVAISQNVDADHDTDTPILLSATDENGDDLSYEIIAGPSHGSIAGTPPNISYKAGQYYSGADEFTFKVSDGENESEVVTVSISVNDVTLYFCGGGEGDWNVLANWYFTDDCSSTPATRLPIDGDSVDLVSPGSIGTGPLSVTYLKSFKGELSTISASPTSNVSILPGGTLNVWNGYWGGVVNSATSTFDSAINQGQTLGSSIATFNNWSENHADVGTAIFNNDSVNNGDGSVVWIGTFNDDSRNEGGAIVNSGTFNGNSINQGGSQVNFATFNDSSRNEFGGSASYNAEFNDLSQNRGEVWGSSDFKGSAVNGSGTGKVWGLARFYEWSQNFGDVIYNAEFYDDSSDYGYVSGTISCSTNGNCITQ